MAKIRDMVDFIDTKRALKRLSNILRVLVLHHQIFFSEGGGGGRQQQQQHDEVSIDNGVHIRAGADTNANANASAVDFMNGDSSAILLSSSSSSSTPPSSSLSSFVDLRDQVCDTINSMLSRMVFPFSRRNREIFHNHGGVEIVLQLLKLFNGEEEVSLRIFQLLVYFLNIDRDSAGKGTCGGVVPGPTTLPPASSSSISPSSTIKLQTALSIQLSGLSHVITDIIELYQHTNDDIRILGRTITRDMINASAEAAIVKLNHMRMAMIDLGIPYSVLCQVQGMMTMTTTTTTTSSCEKSTKGNITNHQKDNTLIMTRKQEMECIVDEMIKHEDSRDVQRVGLQIILDYILKCRTRTRTRSCRNQDRDENNDHGDDTTTTTTAIKHHARTENSDHYLMDDLDIMSLSSLLTHHEGFASILVSTLSSLPSSQTLTSVSAGSCTRTSASASASASTCPDKQEQDTCCTRRADNHLDETMMMMVDDDLSRLSISVLVMLSATNDDLCIAFVRHGGGIKLLQYLQHFHFMDDESKGFHDDDNDDQEEHQNNNGNQKGNIGAAAAGEENICQLALCCLSHLCQVEKCRLQLEAMGLKRYLCDLLSTTTTSNTASSTKDSYVCADDNDTSMNTITTTKQTITVPLPLHLLYKMEDLENAKLFHVPSEHDRIVATTATMSNAAVPNGTLSFAALTRSQSTRKDHRTGDDSKNKNNLIVIPAPKNAHPAYGTTGDIFEHGEPGLV